MEYKILKPHEKEKYLQAYKNRSEIDGYFVALYEIHKDYVEVGLVKCEHTN